MQQEKINKELQRKMWFLVGTSFVICIILAIVIAFLELNYNLSFEYQLLIVVPILCALGVFYLFHMYKKGLLRSDLKRLFEKEK